MTPFQFLELWAPRGQIINGIGIVDLAIQEMPDEDYVQPEMGAGAGQEGVPAELHNPLVLYNPLVRKYNATHHSKSHQSVIVTTERRAYMSTNREAKRW